MWARVATTAPSFGAVLSKAHALSCTINELMLAHTDNPIPFKTGPGLSDELMHCALVHPDDIRFRSDT